MQHAVLNSWNYLTFYFNELKRNKHAIVLTGANFENVSKWDLDNWTVTLTKLLLQIYQVYLSVTNVWSSTMRWRKCHSSIANQIFVASFTGVFKKMKIESTSLRCNLRSWWIKVLDFDLLLLAASWCWSNWHAV